MDKNNLTFGERACGVSFNPGGIPVVNAIKKAYAEIAEQLNDIRIELGALNFGINPEE